MARWHLTSSSKYDSSARELCESASLRPSGSCSSGDCHVRAYAKRAVGSENFVLLEDGGWAAMAGTMVFNEMTGAAALEAVCKLLDKHPLDEVRARLIGHYALAVRKGDAITVFTDEQGTLNLYYASLPDGYVISNSLQVPARCAGRPEIDRMGLLVHVFQIETVGEDTFCPGVKRLFGSEAIHISIPDRKLNVRRLPQEMIPLSSGEVGSASAAVDLFLPVVRDVFSRLSTFSSIGLNATGGLDTRTILGALLDRELRPVLLSGVGNSTITNTKGRDSALARELADEFSLDFREMDWSGKQPHSDEALLRIFTRYGYLAATYGASDSLLLELEGSVPPNPELRLGGYSPAFSNMKIWMTEKRSFSFADLVDHFTTRFFKYLPEEIQDEYRGYLERTVVEALSRSPVEFPDEGATLQQFAAARLFLYIRAEAALLNLANEFSYYLAPFMMKRLYDPLLSMPLHLRRGDEFQLRLVHALCPRLLDVPLFSGLREQKVDLETFTMAPEPRQGYADAVADNRFLSRVWGAIPASVRHALGDALRGNLEDRKKDAALNKLIRQDTALRIQASDEFSDLARLDEFDIGALYKLRYLVFGLKHS